MIEQDLGQIIPDITATATVDNTTGTPEVNITVDEIEELGKLINKFKFSFLHMKGEKGDKPQKGVDYYTPQEKEQFTTETKALVTGEGSKQVSLINAETTKVIQQIRETVAGNEATSNALTLSGKTRLEFEKETQGVAGGFSGTFPLTQATLNGVYLVPATGKFYVCTKEYSGGNLTAPNANFEELSVWKNRDKLENLSEKIIFSKQLKDFGDKSLIKIYQCGKEIWCHLRLYNSSELRVNRQTLFNFNEVPSFDNFKYKIKEGSCYINNFENRGFENIIIGWSSNKVDLLNDSTIRNTSYYSFFRIA